MKRTRFREEQIIAILKETEAGVPAANLCRKHGISEGTFYRWKAKYGGIPLTVLIGSAIPFFSSKYLWF